eukprot:3650535-Rhodomonas_salina.3
MGNRWFPTEENLLSVQACQLVSAQEEERAKERLCSKVKDRRENAKEGWGGEGVTIPAVTAPRSATKQPARGSKPAQVVTTRTGSLFAQADQFPAISHVDEVVGSQCHVHFKTPEHALADEPPVRWPASKDWELAQYLAHSAAVLAVPPEDAALPVAMQVVHA